MRLRPYFRRLARWQQAAVIVVWWLAAAVALIGLLGYSAVETAVALCVGIGTMYVIHAYANQTGLADAGVLAVLRSLLDVRRPTRREWAVAALVAAGSVGATTAIGLAATLYGGDVARHTAATGAGASPGIISLAVIAALAVVLAPLWEELLFRNGLQKILTTAIGPWPSIVGVSLLFMAMHLPSYGGLGQPIDALAFPLAAVFSSSVIYGYGYYRTENVLIPMVAHASHNALALVTLI